MRPLPRGDSHEAGGPRRRESIAAHRAGGGRIAAVFPIHYPRALFRAHGFLPVEVWGPPGIDPTPGDAHLQAYTCSIVHCGLSFLLSGGLDGVDAIVVPHACDSLQGLGSVLLDLVRAPAPVFTFQAPRGEVPATREAAVDFLVAEMRALGDRLSDVSGVAPDDVALSHCVRREEEADALLRALWENRRGVDLPDRRFYEIVRSREFLPAEAFVGRWSTLLGGPPTERGGVPVLLSGLVPEPMDLLDAISGAGGIVVADDHACSGRRLYPPGVSPDPWRRMAESLLDGPADSTRGSPVEARVAHLGALARASGARAVIFDVVKFCEPELFYLPRVRAALDGLGIPSVVCEVDLALPLAHQVATRIEALLEVAA